MNSLLVFEEGGSILLSKVILLMPFFLLGLRKTPGVGMVLYTLQGRMSQMRTHTYHTNVEWLPPLLLNSFLIVAPQS